MFEKTCKDCTYYKPYEGSDDRFVMTCLKDNFNYLDIDRSHCFRFEQKEKNIDKLKIVEEKLNGILDIQQRIITKLCIQEKEITNIKELINTLKRW